MLLLLILLSVVLNRSNYNMLALTAVVGSNLLAPLNLVKEVDTWYLTCIILEVLTMFAALMIKSRASLPITIVSVLLVWCHVVAWKFTGHLPNSVYRTVEPIIEYMNILSLIVFSTPTLILIKESLKKCLHLP